MKELIFLTFLVTIYSSPTERTIEGLSCKVSDNDKKDCGWMGVDQRGCEDLGCCWAESKMPNIPWCFFGVDEEIVGTCEVADSEKKDCGYSGINKDKCEQKGCCWKESSVQRVPWCYYRDGGDDKSDEGQDEDCKVSDSEKIDCGFVGVDEEGCKNNGCCWSPSKTSGVPWCFYKAGQEEVDPIDDMDWDFGD